ncbi:MAG: hypothetical protein NTY63_02760 [Candidatus Bipolaricaulota bacterium]|nr:hypothetical protein [Candidatus Bipolaricaulota bacterium]
MGAGHSFIVFFGNAFPINVLQAIQRVHEACRIYCATSSAVDVAVAEIEEGHSILGGINGATPKGIEEEKGIAWRKGFLRTIVYKG